MSDLEGLIAKLQARFEEPLANRGVRFSLRTRRLPALRGIRRVLVLGVWPLDGFDNFEWETSERGWLGPNHVLQATESLEEQVSAILVRYLNGEIPPFE